MCLCIVVYNWQALSRSYYELVAGHKCDGRNASITNML